MIDLIEKLQKNHSLSLDEYEYLIENSDIYREVYDSQNKKGGEADE